VSEWKLLEQEIGLYFKRIWHHGIRKQQYTATFRQLKKQFFTTKIIDSIIREPLCDYEACPKKVSDFELGKQIPLSVQWVLQVMSPSACTLNVLVSTVFHYMFRP
jgi:hypothetical protein